MAAAPRTARITTASQILWSSGDVFDGWLLLGLTSGQASATVFLDNATFLQQLPRFIKVRITDGVIDPNTRVFWTADMQPPNTRYWPWWYDLTGTLIYPTIGDPTSFTIAADPYTITVPSLVAPGAPSAPPSTTTFPAGGGVVSYIFVNGEVPAGSITSTTGSNGNGVFTLSDNPDPDASLVLYRNGVLQLAGIDFTLSGTTITYVSGRYPRVGDWHRAYYRAQGTAVSSGFTGQSYAFVNGETPTGTIDGTDGTDGNDEFTLTYTPSPSSSLALFRNGLLQFQGTHYTLVNSTITYASGSIPVTGDLHFAYYRRDL